MELFMHYFQLLYILFLFSLGISLVKSYVFVDVKKYIFLFTCAVKVHVKNRIIYMNNTWKTSLQYYLIFYFIFDIDGFLFNKLTRLNIKKNQHKRVKQMFDSNSSRLDVLQQVFLHTNTKVFHCH